MSNCTLNCVVTVKIIECEIKQMQCEDADYFSPCASLESDAVDKVLHLRQVLVVLLTSAHLNPLQDISSPFFIEGIIHYK